VPADADGQAERADVQHHRRRRRRAGDQQLADEQVAPARREREQALERPALALAWVVIGWSARLLEDEKFRYPGLVRAGWGRFRAWGTPPATPGGLEAMAVFAIAVAGFTLVSGNLASLNPIAVVGVPLIAFALVPALSHCWLGAYDPRRTLSLRAPTPRGLGSGALLGLCAIAVSIAIGNMQKPFFPEHEGEDKVAEILHALEAYGLPTMIVCLAVLPGICEELLFRGTVLAGLTTGIGRGGAVVVSSFLFAAMHGSPDRFLPQFVLGMFLAGLTIRSGSIAPAMLAHAIHNGVMVTLEMKGQAFQAWMSSWAAAHPALVIPAAVAAAGAGLGGTIGAVILAKPRPSEPAVAI
jgi:membrane protease YdiL (CAAX protease family)